MASPDETLIPSPGDGFTKPPGFGRSVGYLERLEIPAGYERQSVFEPAEVAALVKYASERGIDTADNLVTRLFRALTEFEKSPNSSTTVVKNGNEEQVRNAELTKRALGDVPRVHPLAG